MEIFGEFFLTASLALFLSFLVAKVVAAALAVGDSDSNSNSKLIWSDDIGESFIEAFRFQNSEAERQVEFVDEVVEQVDRLIAEEVSVERSEITDDLTSGGSAEAAANDGVTSEPDEARAKSGESEVRLIRDEASEAGSRNSDVDEDSDWEGIERDERESDFAAAVKFVENRFVADDDLQAELYGLRKVAMEGTCRVAMPEEALELSDLRVKWLAWQKLGHMPREVAMERYITLLSHNFPAWTEDHHSGEGKSEFSEGKTTMHSVAPAFSTNERESDGNSNVKGVDISGVAVLKT